MLVTMCSSPVLYSSVCLHASIPSCVLCYYLCFGVNASVCSCAVSKACACIFISEYVADVVVCNQCKRSSVTGAFLLIIAG